MSGRIAPAQAGFQRAQVGGRAEAARPNQPWAAQRCPQASQRGDELDSEQAAQGLPTGSGCCPGALCSPFLLTPFFQDKAGEGG